MENCSDMQHLLETLSNKIDLHNEAVLNRVDNFERSVTAQFEAGSTRMHILEAVARDGAEMSRSNNVEIQKSVGLINAIKYIAAGLSAGTVLLIGWMITLAKELWPFGGHGP